MDCILSMDGLCGFYGQIAYSGFLAAAAVLWTDCILFWRAGHSSLISMDRLHTLGMLSAAGAHFYGQIAYFFQD